MISCHFFPAKALPEQGEQTFLHFSTKLYIFSHSLNFQNKFSFIYAMIILSRRLFLTQELHGNDLRAAGMADGRINDS